MFFLDIISSFLNIPKPSIFSPVYLQELLQAGVLHEEQGTQGVGSLHPHMFFIFLY